MSALPEHCPQCGKTPPLWKALGVCVECHYVATLKDMINPLNESRKPDEEARFIGLYHEATSKGWQPHSRYTPDPDSDRRYTSDVWDPHEPDDVWSQMDLEHPDFPGAHLRVSGRHGWYHSDSRGYGLGRGKEDASLRQHLTQYHAAPHKFPDELHTYDESAATPMPRMGVGLAKAGSLAKSLGTSMKASAPKIGGQTPKLGSSGSSFAESLIQQVVEGQDPRDIVRRLKLEDEHEMERSASDVSPAGTVVSPDMIQPGMHIGIRGPDHNGFHTVDTVRDGYVKMKCEDGRFVTIPLSALEDHEVVHAHLNT